ncbi:bifunctional adenosylcobinamide kinase/adenosylcobinamide-phosphate guanylyltransferase [Paenibacillus sp. 2TAB23]|uniref:bifunctional adenosylcobinamide kinase/adenosylcobinamide-phosphate guanylyltransferase n=1 Tax=Paenibacillus sp. 2TAB23 TaxID=3233004 RepID=UPI003F9A72D9
MAVFITGGARSGKSSFAEQYAMKVATKGIYIATCQPFDEELEERISKHKLDRIDSGFHWTTIEEPYDVSERLEQIVGEQSASAAQGKELPVILLDCLTLWLTNWLMRMDDKETKHSSLDSEIAQLLKSIQSCPFPLIIVSNEVGDGIVPAYPLGRIFRDEAGRLNQRVAAICERAFLVTAGIPIDLRAIAFNWEKL